LRCLCGIAVIVSVFASVAGIRSRAAVGWAIAGLVLGLIFGGIVAVSDPAAAAALAIPVVTIVFAVTQWR
jgi:hypothetical protein